MNNENSEWILHECKNCGAKWQKCMLLVGGPWITIPTYMGSDTSSCPDCLSQNTIMFSNREKVNPK